LRQIKILTFGNYINFNANYDKQSKFKLDFIEYNKKLVDYCSGENGHWSGKSFTKIINGVARA
jgi:hypothetical protein